MTTRIGPRMQAAVEFVRANPGCPIKPVAEHITPCPRADMDWSCGYEPVHRAIRAGLIRAGSGKGNAYALYAA